MTILTFLIPVTLIMGIVGLAAFFWNLRHGQYEDLSGDAARILHDDEDRPLPRTTTPTPVTSTITKETAK